MQNCLVTGADGFIGRLLCSRLQQNGVSVRSLLRRPSEGPWDESVVGDITQPLPPEAMSSIDTVFHLAGKAHALSETRQDDEEYLLVNTEGTRRLLEASREAGVSRFVLFSSVKAMGEGGPEELDETSPCRPENPYGKSKLEAERLVLEGNYVPHSVVLRLCMVYGPGMKGNLPNMIEAIDKGRFPPIPEFNNKRSMVHVDDVIQATILAAEKQEAVGQVYIITDGQPCSTRQLYENICKTLGKSIPSWRIPKLVLQMLAGIGDLIGKAQGRRFIFDRDALDKLAGSARYSSKKIERELGLQPQHSLLRALPDIIRSI